VAKKLEIDRLSERVLRPRDAIAHTGTYPEERMRFHLSGSQMAEAFRWIGGQQFLHERHRFFYSKQKVGQTSEVDSESDHWSSKQRSICQRERERERERDWVQTRDVLGPVDFHVENCIEGLRRIHTHKRSVTYVCVCVCVFNCTCVCVCLIVRV
jgi:hypothetical protein